MSDPYLQREKMRYENPIASREFILALLEKSKKPLRFGQIAKKLHVIESQYDALKKRLTAMVRDKQIALQGRGGYVHLVKKIKTMIGTIQRLKDGNVDIIQADETIIPVIHGDVGVYLHGDTVHYRKTHNTHKEFAVVTEVVERRQQSILGLIEYSGNAQFLIPLQRGLPRMRVVHNTLDGDLTDRVLNAEVVDITARVWNVALRSVAGHVMDPSMAEKIAMHFLGLPHPLSSALEQQIQSLSADTAPSSHPDRIDWTHLPLVTIDGKYSRDFDDAVMAKRLDNGHLEIYVAIADVAHYVPVGSPLDIMAFESTTSMYFPKKCIPMLPEALSNSLCSLIPHTPRLALGVWMLINDLGELIDGSVARVVIQSHARMTYAEIEDMIQNQRLTPPWFKDSLQSMTEATKALEYASVRRRALNIRARQDNIVFNEDGLWQSMQSHDSLYSHKLIEKLMVCANNYIAIFLKNEAIEAIYRHHPPVRSEGQEALMREVKYLGIDHTQHADSDLYTLNEYLRQHDAYQWIAQWVVRAMSQARYETQQSAHWGLALDVYVHFTSPIRRYPDLMIHRAVIGFLEGNKNVQVAPVPTDVAARRCSRLERRADAVVYDAIDWYQCQWAHAQNGKIHNGHMVTMLAFGIFVRLVESGVEVLLPSQHIESIGYTYDTLNARWIHPRLLPLTLGHAVKVMIGAVAFPLRRRDAEWINPPHDGF